MVRYLLSYNDDLKDIQTLVKGDVKVVGTIDDLSRRIRIDSAIPEMRVSSPNVGNSVSSEEEEQDTTLENKTDIITIGVVWSSHVYDHIVPFDHSPAHMEPTYIPDKFREFIQEFETRELELDIELICGGGECPALFMDEVKRLNNEFKCVHIERSYETSLSKYINMDDTTIQSLLTIDRKQFALSAELVDENYTFLKHDTTFTLEGIQNHNYLFRVGDDDMVIDGRNCTLVLPDSVTTIYGLYHFEGKGSITLKNITINASNVDIAPSCGLFVHYGRQEGSTVRFENCHISVKTVGMGGGGFVGSETKNIQIVHSSCDIRGLLLPYSGGLIGSSCQDVVITGTSIHVHRGILFPQVGGMIGYFVKDSCTILDSHITIDGNIQGSFVGGIVAPSELLTTDSGDSCIRTVDSCSVHIRGRNGAGGDSFGGIIGTMNNGWNIANSEVTIDGDLYGCKSGGMTGFGSRLQTITNCRVMIGGGIIGDGAGGVTGSTTTLENISHTNVVIIGDISGERCGGLCGYNVRIQQCFRSCHADISGSITGSHSAGMFAAKPVVHSVQDCHVEVHGDVNGIESAVVVGYRSRIQECFTVWCHVYGNVQGNIIFGSEYSTLMKRTPLYIWAIIDGTHKEEFAERVSIISGTNDAVEQLQHVSNSGRQHLLSSFQLKEVTIGSRTIPVYHDGDKVEIVGDCVYLNIFKPDHSCNFGDLNIGYSECTYSQPSSLEEYDLDYAQGGVIIRKKSIDTVSSDGDGDDVVYKHDDMFDDCIEDAKPDDVLVDQDLERVNNQLITWIIVISCVILLLLLLLRVYMWYSWSK